MQSHAPSLSTVLTATYATPNGVADFREVAGQLRLAAPDQQAALERGEGRWRIAWDAYCDHVTFEWEDSDQPWPRLCAACEGPVADNGDLCVQCSYDEQIEWWAGLSDREREEQAMKHPENRAFL